MKRDIIRINEEACTGCGSCVSGCPEGALQLIDGKARVVRDVYCDGLGACIGDCPEGAIDVETREAEPYDERAVMEQIARAGPGIIEAHLRHLQDHGERGLVDEAIGFLAERGIEVPRYEGVSLAGDCSESMMQDVRGSDAAAHEPAVAQSELDNWPIQLRLMRTNAPYLKGAALLVAADCVPFSYATFHQRFLKDRAVIIFCPKLDTTIDEYVDKLSDVFQRQDIASITVVHMEVPCCSGIERIIRRALENAQRNIPLEVYTISISGRVVGCSHPQL